MRELGARHPHRVLEDVGLDDRGQLLLGELEVALAADEGPDLCRAELAVPVSVVLGEDRLLLPRGQLGLQLLELGVLLELRLPPARHDLADQDGGLALRRLHPLEAPGGLRARLLRRALELQELPGHEAVALRDDHPPGGGDGVELRSGFEDLVGGLIVLLVDPDERRLLLCLLGPPLRDEDELLELVLQTLCECLRLLLPSSLLLLLLALHLLPLPLLLVLPELALHALHLLLLLLEDPLPLRVLLLEVLLHRRQLLVAPLDLDVVRRVGGGEGLALGGPLPGRRRGRRAGGLALDTGVALRGARRRRLPEGRRLRWQRRPGSALRRGHHDAPRGGRRAAGGGGPPRRRRAPDLGPGAEPAAPRPGGRRRRRGDAALRARARARRPRPPEPDTEALEGRLRQPEAAPERVEIDQPGGVREVRCHGGHRQEPKELVPHGGELHADVAVLAEPRLGRVGAAGGRGTGQPQEPDQVQGYGFRAQGAAASP
mmetsp:Transcript_4864/g.13643  ORF Transcript_4864/g.13643 Transcript_4864/m.13643 type:complete len:488 (-) Transcript_4864:261-1724(-)